MMFAEIFNQLKELEKKFNEISYPPETTFQPSFSFKIRKAEQDCLQHYLPVFATDEFFEKGRTTTYKVEVHPSVRKNLKKLYNLDRLAYDYMKKRLGLLAYRPEMGSPLEAEFQGKWRIHIGAFVLIYTFDSAKNILTLLIFEHYTRAYDMNTAYA